MLGDLGTERRNLNCNTRLHFKQSIAQKEYIDHLYKLFKDYCSSPPKHLIQKSTKNNFESIKFITRSLPCFNEFREQFYNTNGVKYIPSNIGDLLTPVVLAY